MQKTYIDGLNDAWELAKKLWHNDARTNDDIYGIEYFIDIANDYTPQVALAKLEIYEKEQNEIKVGDVVKSNINQKKYLVLEEIHNDGWDFLALDIEQMEVAQISDSHYYFKKTGKHIDIQSILE